MNDNSIRLFVRRELRTVTLGLATAIGLGGALPAAIAAPAGGVVVSGQGSITAPNSTTTLINQQSQQLALNWSSFNVGSGETVHFVQPSSTSVALNNILSQSPSQIFGRLDANGHVILVNPNGILFGPTAQLNVGSLIASSLELTSFDATKGRFSFQSVSGKPGLIDNEGTITAARGGSVALLGGTVLNNGLIVADYGTVALGAGKVATLDFYGGGLLRLEVSGDVDSNPSGAGAAVTNSGQIEAGGGQVLLTASATQDVFASAVNNTGVIRASRIDNVGGVIELSGSDGIVANSGTLDASGSGSGSTGGTVQMTGLDVGLFGNATVNVSGSAGGGTAYIGGGFHGADANVPDASRTYVSPGSTITADALASGDGGNVAVWSNDGTQFYGAIFARGSGQGAGGFTEVSGKGYLDFEGQVDLQAPSGRMGTLLLDPVMITIQNQGSDTATISGTGPFTDSSSVSGSILTESTIIAQLNAADVAVTTTGGDIRIFDTGGNPVALGPSTANGSTLTLNAGGDITWNSGWSYSNGQLTLNATGNIAAEGTAEPITMSGASLLLQAATGIGSSSVPVLTSGLATLSATNGTNGIYINNTGAALTISGITESGSGAVSVNNAGAIGVAGTVFAAAGGNVGLTSTGAISESGAGLINTAGTLTTQSAGGTTLAANASAVGSFNATNTASGDVQLVNAAPLTIAGISQAGGGAVSVNNTGAIGVAGAVAAGAGSVGLTSTGAISESGGGVINTTGTLTTQSVGGTVLAANASAVGTFNATNTGSGDVSLKNAAALAIGGISQAGGGAVSVNNTGALSTTGSVSTSGAGSITLQATGLETIGALVSATTGSNLITLESTGGNVALNGNVDAGAGSVALLAQAGTITQTGSITASALGEEATLLPTLTTSGPVSTLAANSTGSGNSFTFINAGPLTVGAVGGITGVTTNAAAISLTTSSGGLTLAQSVGSGGSPVNLTAAGTISASGAGLINTAGTLTTVSAGGTTLAANTSAVGSFNATNTGSGGVQLVNAAPLTIAAISQSGGGLVSVNNTGTITVAGTVAAGGGDIGLTSTGVISESGAGLINTTGTLTTQSVGGTALAANQSAVGMFNAANTGSGDVQLVNAAPLTIAGISQSGGGAVSVNDSGAVAVAGAVAAGGGDVGLISTGAISESGAGLINTTGALTTQSVGGTVLAANQSAVGSFNATNTGSGDVQLVNAAPLTIAGISQLGGGAVTVNNAGGTTLAGAVSDTGGAVTLADASGALALAANNVAGAGVTLQGAGITQSAGSTINGGSGDLVIGAGGGAVSMAGALTTTNGTATAVTVRNATAVVLPGISTGAAGTTTIGVAGDVTGAVSQSGSTVIDTGTLTGSTSGVVNLGTHANSIPTLGAFASHGLTLNDTVPLSVAGTVAAGAGGIALTSTGAISEETSGSVDTSGTLRTVSVGGTALAADASAVGTFNATNTGSGDVSLKNAAALTIAGISQSGGGAVSVNNAGAIGVAGAVAAGAGNVGLTSTGAISEGAGGSVSTTGALTTSSAGGTTLANATIGTLSATNAGSGDVNVQNTGALIASGTNSGGGAFDVSATGALTANAITANGGAVKLQGTQVALDGAVAGGTVTADAGTGDITFGTAGAIDPVGVVTLSATSGAILGNSGATTNVTGASLTANAAKGIGSNGALKTNVDTLSATNTTSGDVSINNAGGLTVSGSNSGGGAFNVTAGGALTTNAVMANGGAVALQGTQVALDGAVQGGAVAATATSGDLTFASAGSIEGTGAVTLSAKAGAIVGNDALTAGNPTTPNVTGTSLTVSAADGIGTASDPITTSVGAISAQTQGGLLALWAPAGSMNVSDATAGGSGSVELRAGGAGSSLNIGNIQAGGHVLLVAGDSILGTSSQAAVTSSEVEVRYGIYTATGQLGSTDTGHQIGFDAAPGDAQVNLTAWLPTGTQLPTGNLRSTASNLLITRVPFTQTEELLVFTGPFGLDPNSVGVASSEISSTLALGQPSTSALSVQNDAGRSVLFIDWASYNPNVSLFGTLNPAVCLPGDQREDDTGSGSGGCSAPPSQVRAKPAPSPIRMTMVLTREGWRSVPLFDLLQ
ncbi:MAG: filamentous hemagglutinin N-terminal domain-containing protein [Steroidobacteraceae bacterium]